MQRQAVSLPEIRRSSKSDRPSRTYARVNNARQNHRAAGSRRLPDFAQEPGGSHLLLLQRGLRRPADRPRLQAHAGSVRRQEPETERRHLLLPFLRTETYVRDPRATSEALPHSPRFGEGSQGQLHNLQEKRFFAESQQTRLGHGALRRTTVPFPRPSKHQPILQSLAGTPPTP